MKSVIENISKGLKIKISFLVILFLMFISFFHTFYLNCQINETYKQLQQVNGEIYDLKKEIIKKNNTQRKTILNNKLTAIHFANNTTGLSEDLNYLKASSKIFQPQRIISIISLSTPSKIGIDKLKKRIVKMPVIVFLLIRPEKYNIDWRPL